MEEENRSIAALLRKEQLDEGVALFTYINTIIGSYNKEEGIFTDDQGREYSGLDTEGALLDPYQYVCGNIMSLTDAFDKYKTNNVVDIQEVFNAFDKEESNYYYITGLSDEGAFVILKYNYNEAVNKFFDKIFDENGKVKEELKDADGEIEFEGNINNIVEEKNNKVKNKETTYSVEETLAENIKKNLYTKEQLKKIKTSLLSHKKGIGNLIDLTKRKIDDKNYKTSKTKIDIPKKYIEPSALEKKSFVSDDGLIQVQELYDEVTKTLIAQDEPTRRLIVEIARLDLDENNKHGILLTGSTGVGKTELISLIANYLNRPFLIIDSTQLTSPGYVGKNIEECLCELYESCNKDLDKAERAIVFFDEIDKKGSSKKEDVAGRGVLNVLLKFLDGTKYNLSGTHQNANSLNNISIDTSKMTIIAGGAFTDVYKNPNKNIGFNRDIQNEYVPTLEDFVEKAMMPDEFMGRVPVIIRMNDLDVNSMKEILYKSRKSPIKIQKEKFKQLNVKLKFTDEAITAIAKKADQLKAGARGLSGIVSNITYKPFDKAICYKNKYESFTITDQTVENINNYQAKIKIKKSKQKTKKI